MPDVKISAAPDAGFLLTTDRFPLARAGSNAAYSTSVAGLFSVINGTYSGTWAVAANTPDISGGGRTDAENYIAVTANPATPETAPAGIPGIGGQTIHNGDRILWSASLHIWQTATGLGLDTPSADARYVNTSGDTMAGPLVLAADPTAALGAVTKQYVDNTALQLSNYVRVDGTSTMTGGLHTTTINATGAIATDSSIYVTGDAAVTGNVVAQGNMDCTDFATTGWATIGDTLTVTGAATFKSTVSAPGAVFSDKAQSANGFYCTGGPAIYDAGSIANLAFQAGYAFQLDQSAGQMTYVNATGVGLSIDFYRNFEVYNTAYKPGGGMWTDSSDARVKDITGDFSIGLDAVQQLRPRRFRFRPDFDGRDSGTEYVGFTAQEVERLVPEAVSRGKGKLGDRTLDDLRRVDPTPVFYAVINAIKELADRVQALEAYHAKREA